MSRAFCNDRQMAIDSLGTVLSPLDVESRNLIY
jgi:hypothetical protein